MPYPRSDQAWGVTRAFLDTGVTMPTALLMSPVISIVGEKRQRLVLKTKKTEILSMCHIYDAEGNELVQDKGRDVKYTVLLNRRNPLPKETPEEGEEVSFVYTRNPKSSCKVNLPALCSNGLA